ncbi:hypothetical protein ACWEOE_41875 [Amycolatopsis sp. NPDC004368]
MRRTESIPVKPDQISTLWPASMIAAHSVTSARPRLMITSCAMRWE